MTFKVDRVTSIYKQEYHESQLKNHHMTNGRGNAITALPCRALNRVMNF
jgi:hypothetical protein